MRLLLITNDYPPKPGGIQQLLRQLVDAYPDPVHVLAAGDDRAAEDEQVSRHRAAFMWPRREVADWIITEARAFAPDVLLFGAPHPLAFLGPRLRTELGIGYGVIAHGAEVTLPGATPGLRQMIGKGLKEADVCFTVSRFTAGQVGRLTGQSVTYLGAGVDIDSFAPQPDGGHEVPVVGSVSRFVPRKRLDRLLRAAASLDRPVEVLLVGKGRKEVELRRLADRLGVNTRFVVDAPWSELPGWYRSMDVFCMPCESRWGGLEVEGLGLVFLEASATGLPVLAGDSGGSSETVVPGETGYLVRSVDDIAEGLTMLLDDPVRAKAMGAAGRRFVEESFTWDGVIDRLQAGLEPVAR